MNKDKAVEVFRGGALVLSGYILGIVVPRIGSFTLDTKINPVPVASLLVTVFVSVALFRSFEKQKYSDKLKKDGLLDRLKDVREALGTIEDTCDASPRTVMQLVPPIRKCRASFAEFSRFALLVNAGTKADESQFNTAIKTSNRLLTDTPIQSATPTASSNSSPITNAGFSPSNETVIAARSELDRARRILNTIETSIILKV